MVPPSRVARGSLLIGDQPPRHDAGPCRFFGYVAEGFLHPGREATVPIGFVADADTTGLVAWFCRDVQNNVHLRGYDGSYRVIPAKDYLERKGPNNIADYFSLVYPDVPVPKRNAERKRAMPRAG